jgi:uncharacterized protein YndB with AHSA1/START domain
MIRAWMTALAIFAAAPTVSAEVVQSSPAGVTLQHRYDIGATPAEAWQALVHPGSWWPQDHNWSGNSSNMRLVPEAGGCFCEQWEGGSVEHGRVISAMEPRLLRFEGALGPLQEMAVTAVLTVALEPTESGTKAVVTYRVSGDASHAIDQFAPVVDQVVGQQFGAFAAYASRDRK